MADTSLRSAEARARTRRRYAFGRTSRRIAIDASNNSADAAKTALRRLAGRHHQLSEEISEADHEITPSPFAVSAPRSPVNS